MSELRRRLRVLGALLALILPGCDGLADSDALRVCRTLLPVLDPDAEQIEIVGTVASGRTSAVEQAVAIDYRALTRDGRRPMRRISCLYAVQPLGAPVDAWLGVASTLDAVVTDEGAVGPLRLYLLKQNWLTRGMASAADPAPFASFGRVPDVTRWTAVAVQTLVSALPIMSIYALLGAAYALVYGLVGRINLAFGELTMLAGYGTILGVSAFGEGGAGALVSGLGLALYTGMSHGAALGRWVLVPLVGRPGQHVLIATIGLSLFWSELVRVSQGNANRWMGPVFNRPLALVRDGTFVVTITPMALVVPAVAATAAVALLAGLHGTRFGRRWRAFADDPVAAEMLGVDPRRLIMVTMLAASGCAALAGFLTTLYYGGVGFAGGQLVGLKALIAAVIGGIGSVQGALLGGVVLGLAEAVWSALFAIEFRDPAIFLALIVMLALRPAGLLGGRDGR